jgi:hypothetical protein
MQIEYIGKAGAINGYRYHKSDPKKSTAPHYRYVEW